MRIPSLGEFKVLSLRECPPDLFTAGACHTPEKAAEYWRVHIASEPRFNGDVESMVCLCLSTRRKVIGYNLIATGTLDTILCHPREVLRAAIVASAAAIILMHNHPSGDSTPSEADVKVTRDLIRGG